MRYYLSMISARFGQILLAGMAVPLFFSAPCRAAEAATPVFRITNFVLEKDGKASLQWVGPSTNIVIQYTADLGVPDWQPLPGVAWPISGTTWSGVMPMTSGKGFLRVFTTGDAGTTGAGTTGAATTDTGTGGVRTTSVAAGGLGTAPIPMQTISLSLIAWHDPQAAKFMRDCIACHGTRTQELALDGKTKTAHSIMLSFYGGGNDRCINCHYNGPKYTGPDFLTQSAGALRKQVNYEINGCTSCHAKGSFVPLYDRY